MNRRSFLCSTSALGAGILTPTVFAQSSDYPNKPIKYVVPFAAGGGGDGVARIVAQQLGEQINQTVIVENRAGAGGNIGVAYVLKSAPDGYTLLNMSSTYAIQAAMTELPFDPLEDVQPIMMISRDPTLLLARPGSSIKTVAQLITASRLAVEKLTYGSAGVGSLAHLGMEQLALTLGIQLTHIPYKGSSQAFNDLLGNNVDLMLTGATFASSFVRSGRIHAIGIVGATRSASMPDLATFQAQGVKDYDVYDWKAVAGPKGIPQEVVTLLNRELNAAIRSPAVSKRFVSEGTSAIGGTPEDLMRVIRSDIAHWKSVIKLAKIK